MPCNWIKIGETVVHVRTSGGRKPKSCFYCGTPGARSLCDFPVGKYKNGQKKTCDLAMCERCTSRGASKNVDFCRAHYPIAKAAYERRLQKKASGNLFGEAFLTNREISTVFRLSRCRCSAAKWENSAFCNGCYDDLSRETKTALKRKFGQGFESAYRQACAELDGVKVK